MKIGVDVSQHQLTWQQLVDRVRWAEDAGFDSVWVFDHFKALYGDPTGPCFEAWTTIAALAAVTTRVRLGPLVSGVTYRHPSILAAEIVTADHVSDGRIDIGIGAAWFAQEHHELGIDFPSTPERAARLEEAVQVMKLLMTTDGATFGGRYYRLRDATYRPRPVQQPHPPFWVGASGEKLTIPIAARHADVWHTYGDAATLRHKSHLLDDHARAAGRDPSEIKRSTNLSLSESWDEIEANAMSVRDLGFDYLIASWPAQGEPRVEEFLTRIAPELAARA